MLDRKTDNKNLKDTNLPLPNLPLYRGRSEEGVLSYTKTNKLITALYMVTDIIDKDEPLRNKLRTLGTGIISDMQYMPVNACSKISEIMSFLDIASAINIISEMNTNILRKEFIALNQSIIESTGRVETPNRQINLAEFLKDELPAPKQYRTIDKYESIGHIGQQRSTRIGVQKGSTLMKALSDRTKDMSKNSHVQYEAKGFRLGFDILKKQRRDNIINIINIVGKSATIKDIRDKVQAMPEQSGILISCSEKTLQRELMSMIKDNVLYKTGEKRWSRYIII